VIRKTMALVGRPCVYGIKLCVLTRNFSHEYSLYWIYNHPFRLYKPTQEESENNPGYRSAVL